MHNLTQPQQINESAYSQGNFDLSYVSQSTSRCGELDSTANDQSSNNNSFNEQQSSAFLMNPPDSESSALATAAANLNKNRTARRRQRTKFEQEHLNILEQAFKQTHYPDVNIIDRLANMININSERICVWFQNRRARFKRLKHRSDKDDEDEQPNPLPSPPVSDATGTEKFFLDILAKSQIPARTQPQTSSSRSNRLKLTPSQINEIKQLEVAAAEEQEAKKEENSENEEDKRGETYHSQNHMPRPIYNPMMLPHSVYSQHQLSSIGHGLYYPSIHHPPSHFSYCQSVQPANLSLADQKANQESASNDCTERVVDSSESSNTSASSPSPAPPSPQSEVSSTYEHQAMPNFTYSNLNTYTQVYQPIGQFYVADNKLEQVNETTSQQEINQNEPSSSSSASSSRTSTPNNSSENESENPSSFDSQATSEQYNTQVTSTHQQAIGFQPYMNIYNPPSSMNYQQPMYGQNYSYLYGHAYGRNVFLPHVNEYQTATPSVYEQNENQSSGSYSYN